MTINRIEKFTRRKSTACRVIQTIFSKSRLKPLLKSSRVEILLLKYTERNGIQLKHFSMGTKDVLEEEFR